MPTLAEALLAPEKRPQVIEDCTQVIEDEVASKRGVSGLAIKTGFKTVKAFKRTIVPDMVGVLLESFVEELKPFYEAHLEAGGGEVQAFMVAKGDRIADALLGITDRRAAGSRHKALVKVYKKLRPKAAEQVVVAMPRIGQMLAKHGL